MHRAMRVLASRRLSFALLASWCGLLAIWVLPFMLTGLPETQVGAIASTWLPFRVVYALIVLTTLACVFLRLEADIRRVRTEVKVPDETWSRATPDVTVEGLTVADAASRLSARGWTVKVARGMCAARKNRSSLLGGSAFHVGIVVLVLVVVAYPSLSQTGEFRLIEGETVGTGTAERPDPLRALVADARLVEVIPRYYQDVLLFERLDAKWARAGGRQETFSLASPLWLDPLTTISIQDYGLAPRFTVRTGSQVVQDSIVAMSIFPPGNEDTTVLDNAGLELSVRAFTDYGIVNGQDVSKSYNIGEPRLLVSAGSAEGLTDVLARELLAVGDTMAVNHPSGTRYDVTFSELKRYGSFRIARSWFPILVLLAGVLIVGGMALRVWRPRVDVVAWDTGEGLAIAIRADKVGVSVEHMVSRDLAQAGTRR